MWKKQCLALLLALTMLLCACGQKQTEEELPLSDEPRQETLDGSREEEGMKEPLPPAEEENPVPEPQHSPLYLPEYTAQQITEYFEEVVLNVEYSDGTGADRQVQKWLYPIYYRVYGMATDADLAVLEALAEQLNAIEGFPGLLPAAEDGQENMSIHFLYPDAFRDSFSAIINGEEAYGAVQFWYYTLSNELHTANIGCRVDIDQSVRNSVLVEEVINALGITDTVLRTDSITYQYSDENEGLSQVDLVILKLLYDPAIQCGMDAAACAAVIEQLYY